LGANFQIKPVMTKSAMQIASHQCPKAPAGGSRGNKGGVAGGILFIIHWMIYFLTQAY